MTEILTCLSAVCTLATIGGYEQGMFGFAGFIVRFAVFAGATYIFGGISAAK